MSVPGNPARLGRLAARPFATAALAAALLLGTGCTDDSGPDQVISETEAPENARTITLREDVPHWLNESRDQSLAIMRFLSDPVRADVGHLQDGENTVHTMGIDDTIDAAGSTWRVVEITPGDDGSLELAEVG